MYPHVILRLVLKATLRSPRNSIQVHLFIPLVRSDKQDRIDPSLFPLLSLTYGLASSMEGCALHVICWIVTVIVHNKLFITSLLGNKEDRGGLWEFERLNILSLELSIYKVLNFFHFWIREVDTVAQKSVPMLSHFEKIKELWDTYQEGIRQSCLQDE